MKNIKFVLTLLLIAGLFITSGLGVFAKNTKGSEADNEVKAEKVESSAKENDAVEMKTATIGKQTWYLVENEQQLRSIGTGQYSMSGNYMLNTNITLSKKEWTPIGDKDNPFKGSFNGNGFEIRNLTITSPTAKLIGLFGYAEGAKIYNIYLKDVDISKAGGTGKSVGAIVVFGMDCEVHGNIVEPIKN